MKIVARSSTLDVDAAIRRRVTTKVLASKELPVVDHRAIVEELIALAGHAPFHRACNEEHRCDRSLSGIEPWRFHALDSAGCRSLKSKLPVEKAGKIPAMLSAADALLLATWLPNPADESFDAIQGQLFEPTLANMEHIAAASAAIQSLLLAATARSISSYWSSGGAVLRSPEVFELLTIPNNEILLGAVFLFPNEVGDAQSVGSKLRDHRSPLNEWFRWVDIDSVDSQSPCPSPGRQRR